MRFGIIALIIIGIAAAGGAAWYYSNQSNGDSMTEETAQGVDILEQTGTLAKVNGKDITSDKVYIAAMQIAASQGVSDLSQLDEQIRIALGQQALSGAISHALVLEVAAAKGITVTDAEVSTQFDAAKSQFPDEAAFNEALSSQNMTEEKLRAQIRENIVTQRYFDQELNFEGITVTDEEIQAQYDNAVATANGQEVPALEELREQITAFVTQQKQQQIVNAHIESLREDAEIEILI